MNDYETIINFIAGSRQDYKCFDLLKELLKTNSSFLSCIEKGISEGQITGFSDKLWEQIDKQNIRDYYKNFENYFANGFNLGRCTYTSRQLSFSFQNCYICGGVLDLLKNTTNSEDGSHTWIEDYTFIYDTTLMLKINHKYKEQLGYKTENRINPNLDNIYAYEKEFTNDTSLRRH